MGCHMGWIYGHRQADQVKWSPADGKQHKDHEHGDEIPQVTWPEARALLCLHFASHLDDVNT